MQNMEGSRTQCNKHMRSGKAALSQQYCSEYQAIAMKTNVCVCMLVYVFVVR